MTPEKEYLELPSGVRLPARIFRVGPGRTDAIIANSSVSHTASVPPHSEIAEDIIVTDGRYEYDLVFFEFILGKYRLQLVRR